MEDLELLREALRALIEHSERNQRGAAVSAAAELCGAETWQSWGAAPARDPPAAPPKEQGEGFFPFSSPFFSLPPAQNHSDYFSP